MILQEIHRLLTTEMGSLAYHLVIAFCVAGALQLVFLHPTAGRLRTRQLIGLGLLLIFQLGLFVMAGLAWQGVAGTAGWMPVLDRLIALLSALILVWLWGFPEGRAGADAATILLFLLSLAGGVLGGLWWSTQAPGSAFNGQWVDLAAQGGILLLSLLGLIILILRRPENWGMGVAMLTLLGLGSLLHLWQPPTSGDYSGWMRLAQMAAFPFLLTLPQRLVAAPLITEEPAVPVTVELPKEAGQPDTALWDRLFQAAAAADADAQAQALARLLAEEASAEICLLTDPFIAGREVLIWAACDRASGRTLPAFRLDSRDLPLFISAQRLGRARRLPAENGKSELRALAQLVQLDHAGEVLFLPVNRGETPLAAAILLNPRSEVGWPPERQAFLQSLARLVVQILQPMRTMTTLHTELSQARQVGHQAQEELRRMGEERQRLRDQLVVAQEEAKHARDQVAGLEAMLTAQSQAAEEAQLGLQRLEVERKEWQGLLERSRELEAKLAAQTQAAQAAQQAAQRLQAEVQHARQEAAVAREQLALLENQLAESGRSVTTEEAGRVEQLQAEIERLQAEARQAAEQAAQAQNTLERELRRSLEEISLLKISLADADQRISQLKGGVLGDEAVAQQLELIVSVAQDLRQPLSSIVGYVDFLLSESVGILGASQRKYLERIKVSTERMNRLIDELVQVASTESNPARLQIQETNLGTCVTEVLAGLAPFIQQKHIELKVEIPPDGIILTTDAEALKWILMQLLRNACAVTPQGSAVSLSARLEKTEGQEDYVLVQVADQGGGIPGHELPRVFSPHPPGTWLAGVSHNGADLPAVKTLVEALGGRTWVDSEIGQGTTFSILLPVSPLLAEEGLTRKVTLDDGEGE